MVVEKESEADQPGRAQSLVMGEDEAQRPDDVGGGPQQHLAFPQGLADQAEFAVFEVAQAAVDKLGAGRGGAARQVVLFAEQHRKPPSGGVTGDAAAVYAAADNGQVKYGGRHI